MIKVIKTINEFLEILQKHDISENTYMSYDYYRVYLKYFPPKNILCYCVWEGENCIGLLPLYRKGTHFEIIGFRASNYLGYICRKQDTERVDQEITKYIEMNNSLHVIDFYDINTATSLYPILNGQNRVKTEKLYSCPYVDCAQDFEQLFTTQVSKSKKRTELKKFAKKLEIVGTVRVYNIDSEESWEKNGYLINDIYRLHAERFADVYIPENVCLHKNEQYYTELFKSLVIKGKALLSILTIDDVTVSFLYTAVSDGIVMDWMPAFDPAFTKYNLGTVHLMKLLEYLCRDEKYTILDFSKGAAVYKARWAKDETFNYMMVKRYSDHLISKINVALVMAPIKLKNELRSKGILDKMKDLLVKVKGTKVPKNKALSVGAPSVSIVDVVPPEVEMLPFHYGEIRTCTVEQRKNVLDALYNGAKPHIARKDSQTFIALEAEDKNDA